MATYPSRAAALDAVRTLIAFIGDNPEREGLVDTPDRVLQAWARDWGSGYCSRPGNLIKLFDAAPLLVNDQIAQGAQAPMIIVDNLTFHSTCEHHMAPFFGSAVVAYIPDQRGRIGLSKFARIIDHFAHRLQVQERLTDQVADFLVANLSNDCAITLRATHMCMVSRGVRQPNALTTTSALRGAFYDERACRDEFFGLTSSMRSSSLRCS